jgi:hypothetical protein
VRTFTTAGRHGRLALAAVLVLVALPGCGAATAWHASDGKQGRELETIIREDRKIPVEAADGLPLRFDPIQIERKVDERRVLLRAVAVWRLAGSRDDANAMLGKLAAKLRPDAARGEVRRVYLKLQFRDKDGQAYAEEKATLEVSKDVGIVELYQLAGAGSPAKVTTTVEDVGVYIP